MRLGQAERLITMAAQRNIVLGRSFDGPAGYAVHLMVEGQYVKHTSVAKAEAAIRKVGKKRKVFKV